MTTPHPENPQGQIPPQPPEGQLPPPPAQAPYPQAAPGQAYPAPAQGYGPQALDPAQQRQWGMFAHLVPLIAMVLSAGLLGFVG